MRGSGDGEAVLVSNGYVARRLRALADKLDAGTVQMVTDSRIDKDTYVEHIFKLIEKTPIVAQVR